MTQLSEFDDGSFVLHKWKVNGGQGWASVWFTACGSPRDVEMFNALGRRQRVPAGVWSFAARHGNATRKRLRRAEEWAVGGP
jgi:hypothetical protein